MSTTLEESQLELIVGLATNPFECDPPPANSDVSLSGLYLDSIFDAGLFTSLSHGSDSFWTRLEQLRMVAIKDVYRDVYQNMQKYIIQRRQRFQGAIGGANSKQVLHSVNGKLVGIRLYCADVVGGIITIPKIGTWFADTGTITLYVYDQWGNELYSFNINTLAGKYVETTLTTPIVLELHNDLTRNAEYYLVYSYDNTVKPYINGIDCKCGSWRPYFDRRRPYFNTQTGKNYAFSHWVMPGGFIGDIDDLDCALCDVTDTYMNGLVLRDVTIDCDNSYIVNHHTWNFANPWDLSFAFAILHKWAIYAIDYLINTPEFDRENLLNKEILINTKLQLMQDYEKEIKYVASEFPVDESDCFTCRDYGMNTVSPNDSMNGFHEPI